MSADDAANTLKKVVAFQSDSEDDDVREAPAPAPERFDGDSDDSTRRPGAIDPGETFKEDELRSGTRHDILGNTEEIRQVHDARQQHIYDRGFLDEISQMKT